MGRADLTRRLLGLSACGIAAVALGACGADEGPPEDADLVAGKQAFVERCGSCHILERAGTTGTVGPNLDAAFRQALTEGFGRAGVRGIVEQQILFPADVPVDSPAYMPADLVTGKAAEDVAAYVAFATSQPGEDIGLLGEAVQAPGEGEPAVAENGVLEIAADPSGQLAYVTSEASAEAGALEINSPNESSVPHNIALEGGGINEIGPVIQDGAVSTINVDVEAGEYAFYCSVPGHREGGMEGVLAVE